MDERNCKECVHYVVKAARTQQQEWCAGYIHRIFGCEAWECEFKKKKEEEQ